MVCRRLGGSDGRRSFVEHLYTRRHGSFTVDTDGHLAPLPLEVLVHRVAERNTDARLRSSVAGDDKVEAEPEHERQISVSARVPNAAVVDQLLHVLNRSHEGIHLW